MKGRFSGAFAATKKTGVLLLLLCVLAGSSSSTSCEDKEVTSYENVSCSFWREADGSCMEMGLGYGMSASEAEETLLSCPTTCNSCNATTNETRSDAIVQDCVGSNETQDLCESVAKCATAPAGSCTHLLLTEGSATFASGVFDNETSLFADLEELVLWNSNVAILPDYVFGGLNSLETLIINDCAHLRHIGDDTLRGLENLDTLFIRDVPLQTIGSRALEDMTRLASLTLLNAANFSLGDDLIIPSTVQNLYVSNASIQTTPSFLSSMTNLVNVFLGWNELSSLDVGFLDAANETVQYVILNDNKIEEVKVGMFNNLGRLVSLHLTSNLIESIEPGSFDGLASLTDLWISSNRLTYISAGVFDHPSLSLRTLYLHDNFIESIDPFAFASSKLAFSNHANLERLRLDNNRLTQLNRSTFGGRYAISMLKLDSNDFVGTSGQDLAASLVGLGLLYTLRADSNTFESAAGFRCDIGSETGSQFSYLSKLFLRASNVSDLEDDTLNECKNLEQIDLGENDIEVLPSKLFDDTSLMRRIWLDHNGLTEIDAFVFDTLENLEFLDLSANKLTDVSNDAFAGTPGLIVLDLSSNYLTQLDQSGWLHKLLEGSVVEEVNLDDNKILYIQNGVFEDNHCQHRSPFSMTSNPSTCSCDGVHRLITCECDPLSTHRFGHYCARAEGNATISLVNAYSCIGGTVPVVGGNSSTVSTAGGHVVEISFPGSGESATNAPISGGLYYLGFGLEAPAALTFDDSPNVAIGRGTMPSGRGTQNVLFICDSDFKGSENSYFDILAADASELERVCGRFGAVCYYDYGAPNVTSVDGCPLEGCAREGGDVITLKGENFGSSGALGFVNGNPCVPLHHGDNDTACNDLSTSRACHEKIVCEVPAIDRYQIPTSGNSSGSGGAEEDTNEVLLLQSNLFGSTSDVRYARCDTGTYQHRSDTNNKDLLCESCPAGRYSDTYDTIQCIKCSVGKYTSDAARSTCDQCAENFHAKFAGLTVCEECSGYASSPGGSPSCADCTFFYYGSRDHCKTPVLGILFGLFGFVCLICIGVYVRRWSKRHRRRERELKADLNRQVRDIELLSAAWKIRWDDVTLLDRIARGSQGEVWRAAINGTPCAIKKMYTSEDLDISEDSEIAFLQRARHHRLITFVGFGRMNDGNIFIALEFMRGGSLESAIYGDNPPSWVTRVSLLADVAEGMTYLHQVHGSIHRDLKSANVLLDEEKGGKLRAKVADFGLSKIMSARPETPGVNATTTSFGTSVRNMLSGKKRRRRKKKKGMRNNNLEVTKKERNDTVKMLSSNTSSASMDTEGEMSDVVGGDDGTSFPGGQSKVNSTLHATASSAPSQHKCAVMTSGLGTALWMAPELLRSLTTTDGVEYDQSVDTYAFGVIMYECWNLELPWSHCKFSHEVYDKVIKGERPVVRKDVRGGVPSGYEHLMETCWDGDPSVRPLFTIVYKDLQAIYRSTLVSALLRSDRNAQKRLSAEEEGDDDRNPGSFLPWCYVAKDNSDVVVASKVVEMGHSSAGDMVNALESGDLDSPLLVAETPPTTLRL
eukprot:g3981.t1